MIRGFGKSIAANHTMIRNKMNGKWINTLLVLLLLPVELLSQSTDVKAWWHGQQRNIHYVPRGKDFVLANGNMRFNRALYGTNTGFRVEAGDLPEFALYMPGMGGNFKIGLIAGNKSKWLTAAAKITATYRAGSMLYTIKDSLLGNGTIHLAVQALADAEGMIIKLECNNVPATTQLAWAFGGASGKKFSRDGDIGADPESSFYLQPEYCRDNRYTIEGNTFQLAYGSGKVLSEADRYGNKPTDSSTSNPMVQEKNLPKQLIGIVPVNASLRVVDATKQSSPLTLLHSGITTTPAIAGKLEKVDGLYYFMVRNPGNQMAVIAYADLQHVFDRAESSRKKLSERVIVHTPDPYINTLGGALSVAADAIWEEPSYMHGAIAWRMRLNAWRGPYVADPLGWHDRARMHFSAYAYSQVLAPESGPVVADTALGLARQLEKMGTSIFSSGYISRNPNNNKVPHHYDMNLVYIDELLNHFNWTGDLDFVKQMWPVLQRHLAWEKRNFDMDGDGLYDAYAAIWASDALQYSGGGVTHSSAYNYRANKMAASLAVLLGENGSSYANEADKILRAVNQTLWMKDKGWYAEYKDLLGNKMLHPAAGLWTIYHAIDEQLADPFQAYQSLNYIDKNIPHIPVQAKGLAKTDLYVLSTTNWHPYEWSLNNVALAESQHTALANWQGGRADAAYKIWESSLIESMYVGASPGGFQQLTYYDAFRGELYRDFADGIGMTARALVEGLYGINPNALQNTLTIKPGFPSGWKFASIQTPDINFDFKRKLYDDTYTITPTFQQQMDLKLLLSVRGKGIKKILINGKQVTWKNIVNAINEPVIEVNCPYGKKYKVVVSWIPGALAKPPLSKVIAKGERFMLNLKNVQVLQVKDAQHVLADVQLKNNVVQGNVFAEHGHHILFIQVLQSNLQWWMPVHLEVRSPIEIIAAINQPANRIAYSLRNNTTQTLQGEVVLSSEDKSYNQLVTVKAHAASSQFIIPPQFVHAGSNRLSFTWEDAQGVQGVYNNIINWNVVTFSPKFEHIDLGKFFNDKVTQIFKNKYRSPRPVVPTLQLPVQGIGEWTHPMLTAHISDSGLRRHAGLINQITLPQGITFTTPGDTLKSNIVFTSQWNNYPHEVVIPLSGNAGHAYLLMAGSTNTMQSRLVNGAVIATYTNATADTLLLKNPENWWPIEQDYYDDGYAFSTGAPRPVRIHLQTGKILSDSDTRISKNTGKKVYGGAATVLDMPLDRYKTLQSLKLQSIANDVVIGLMSVTLVR